MPDDRPAFVVTSFPCRTQLRLCLLVGALLAVIAVDLGAQTNPTAQPLPYSQDFGSAAFSALPTGVAAWNGLNGGSVSSLAAAAASVPTGDAAVATATTAQTTGGSYGFATGGNARFYLQPSSNATNGANQLKGWHVSAKSGHSRTSGTTAAENGK